MPEIFLGFLKSSNALNNIPNSIIEIIERIMRNDGQVYIVGGAVRNMLLQKPVEDWDLATSKHPDEIEKLFQDKTIVPIGREFGTLTLVSENLNVQITTFRKEEKYSDHRHPDSITYESDIFKDLARRDFTINAIACNPFLKEPIVDPYAGIKDLEKGLIRTVGNSNERFAEDPLRILRCVRFLSELKFTIEEQTYSSACMLSTLLTHISKERIREEFSRILIAPHSDSGVSMLLSAGMINVIFPDFPLLTKEHLALVCKAMTLCKADLILRLAAFFYPLRNTKNLVHQSLIDLKYDTGTIRSILIILANANLSWLDDYENLKYNLRKLLNQLGYEDLIRTLELANAYSLSSFSLDTHANNFKKEISLDFVSVEAIEKGLITFQKILNDPICLKDLAIDGHDLLNSDIKFANNSEIGYALRKALDIVHRNPEFNSKDILMKKLKEDQ